MAKMGFEKQRFVKQYNNVRVRETVGGKECNFRSKLEYRVALYLELLKKNGSIAEWYYEFMKFQFPDDSWLIDFTIKELDGEFYHIESKGHFEARDRKKLKLLFKYFPQARVLYVFSGKKDKDRMGLSRKYCWWREPVCIQDLTRGFF